MSYLMRTSDDCGPAAISFVTGIEYERILQEWPGGWGNSDRGKLGFPNDTPSDHFALLNRFNIPYRIVTCGEILAGNLPPDKVIALLHGDSFAAQHWVVVERGHQSGVSVHWGDGRVRHFNPEAFQKSYSAGWPACAYVIGEGSTKVSWWHRLLAWFTGRV